jgi:hypothetical protein
MKKNSIYETLENRVVGISISESQDLAQLGMGNAHLVDVHVELARHLLSYGSVLMYGGDLRENGFTMNLFDLVESYIPSSIGRDRLSLINYLGWPLDSTLTEVMEAKLSGMIQFEKPGLPIDIVGNHRPKSYLPPKNPKHYYLWARSMSHMRNQMIKKNDARVALGGRLTGFKGKYPGVVEEIYLSLKQEKPIYLIGAFGGATKRVISALQGGQPIELSDSFQSTQDVFKNNLNYYNSKISKISKIDDKIDYTKLVEFFNNKGVGSLNNGLTLDENKRLFSTPHIPEIVSLIIKGLVALG